MEVNFAIIIVTVVIMNIIINIVKLMIVRWDCEESSQIWASCSDVKIKPKI